MHAEGSLATNNDITFDPDTLLVEIYEIDSTLLANNWCNSEPHFITSNVISTLAAVTIGFDKAVYTVAESEIIRSVEVCAVMNDATEQDCLVDFEFHIIFFTSDGTACT